MGFRIVDDNIKLPALYPSVERELPTVKTKGWTRVGGFLLRDKVDFMPQLGLQENVCSCESNIIYMCGEATGGKSFAGILMVLYGCDKTGRSSAMISTRLQDSKKGSSIFRDNELVLGLFGGCEYNSSEYPTFAWPQWKSVHRLIHSNFNTNNPTERLAFIEYAKKNQNGFQYFDEANDLPEFQYNYWNSRNRDASGLTPQSVYSFNPPGPDNYFTKHLVNGGYIGADWYFKPEMNGKTRYFYALGDSADEFVWGDTPEEVCAAAGIELKDGDRAVGLTEADMVKSFTAFLSDSSENRILVSATQGGSIANLHATGKTQRAVLKGAYFGPIDDETINVTRSMITSMWSNPLSEDETPYATFDVGGGKGDSAPLIIWRGMQMVAIEYFTGEPGQLSGWLIAKLRQYGVPVENFAYDATGFGYYVQALSDGVAVTANKRPIKEYDQYGNESQRDEFFNLRSQLLGRLEVALKQGEISCVIPQDKLVKFGIKADTRRFADVLVDGINLFITTQKSGKTYYNSKEEFKARFGYSPGEMDAMILRMVFCLDSKERKKAPPRVTEESYSGIYRNQGSHWNANGINW